MNFPQSLNTHLTSVLFDSFSTYHVHYVLLCFSEEHFLILLENFKLSFNYQLLFCEGFLLFCSILGFRFQEFLNSPNKTDLYYYHFSYSFKNLYYSSYIDTQHCDHVYKHLLSH